MLADGHFYPQKTMTAEDRLWWYAQFFDNVEVNASFYAPLSADNAVRWVKRTPPGFLFHVKAYALLTGHHLDAARLPPPLAAMLPVRVPRMRAARSTAPRFPPRPARGPSRRSASRSGARRRGQARLRPLPDGAVGTYGRRRSTISPACPPRFPVARWRWSFATCPGCRHAGRGVRLPGAPWPQLRLGRCAEDAGHACPRRDGVDVAGGRRPAARPERSGLLKPAARGVAERGREVRLPLRRAELTEIVARARALDGRARRVYLELNNNVGDAPAINGGQIKELLGPGPPTATRWRPNGGGAGRRRGRERRNRRAKMAHLKPEVGAGRADLRVRVPGLSAAGEPARARAVASGPAADVRAAGAASCPA